eukprot:364291-Chlamydomonas_euryale.AAC.4
MLHYGARLCALQGAAPGGPPEHRALGRQQRGGVVVGWVRSCTAGAAPVCGGLPCALLTGGCVNAAWHVGA